VIADKFVDLYARNSGVRDKLVAERDVVLTTPLSAVRSSIATPGTTPADSGCR